MREDSEVYILVLGFGQPVFAAYVLELSQSDEMPANMCLMPSSLMRRRRRPRPWPTPLSLTSGTMLTYGELSSPVEDTPGHDGGLRAG